MVMKHIKYGCGHRQVESQQSDQRTDPPILHESCKLMPVRDHPFLALNLRHTKYFGGMFPIRWDGSGTYKTKHESTKNPLTTETIM
jgi:hypothetical protein